MDGLFSHQGPYPLVQTGNHPSADLWSLCLIRIPYLHVILWEEVSRTHHVTRPKWHSLRPNRDSALRGPLLSERDPSLSVSAIN